MDARQDANGRSTLLWVSSVDGKTPIPIRVNPITGRVLIEMIWTAVWIQPSGTPFSVWQIPVYLSTDGYTVGALSGSGYIKLVSGVPSVLSAIVASDITQSASYRFVTDTEKSTWNGKQNALGFTPENLANKGLANGYAGLDATGKVPSAQLPSFVDDVLEYANLAGFPWTGETGKIYVALDTNKTYRWSWSAYVEISPSPWSTDSVTEGSTNLYFTTARVLGTLLTGLSTVTNAVITASDSVLSALGKLQKQITDLTTTVGTKANDNAVVHLANTETVTGQKKFNKIVESNMDNTTNGAGIRANASDHVYFEWLVNLVRKAYLWFAGAANTTFTINNEMTNGDINLVTNGTGNAKVNNDKILTETKPTLKWSVQNVISDTDGTTITFDMSNSNQHKVTLWWNRTLAVSNVSVWQYFAIDITQDATGSRVPTFFSTIKWVWGVAPTLTTTGNKTDKFVFYCESAGVYQGFVVGKNI